MRWKKHGIVYAPDGSQPWATSHAMIPTPVLLPSGVLRMYCAFCDASGIARPGYVDLDAENPMRVLGVSPAPLLDTGLPGCFDENGVLPCSVAVVNGQYYMYYAGFELGAKIRYRLLTGLAISDDGAHFTRVSPTAVLERSPAELYFRGGPFAVWDEGKMRLWYVAGSEWTDIGGKAMPVYGLRYAESRDGVIWPPQGQGGLQLGSDEHGVGRPWVVRGSRGYELYFSVRKRSLGAYRLGYATSSDGMEWTRDDAALGLDVSPSGFDSEAIMYSAVITLGGITYCFYNGNDFGRAGFALAERIA